MRITKPNPSSTVRVVAMDVESGKSKSMTVYDVTPEAVIDLLRSAADDASDHSDADDPSEPAAA
jgi:hypothetical protein